MANLKQNFLINKTFRLNFSVHLSFNIISKIYIMFSMPKNLSMFALFLFTLQSYITDAPFSKFLIAFLTEHSDYLMKP